jgi:hypothetical protein
MLPFDNKSEFQIVLDMPVGTPLEETARVLAGNRQRGRQGAGSERLPGLRGHRQPDQLQWPGAPVLPAGGPGTWRPAGQPGRPQQRSRQSHEIAISVRDAVEAIGRRAGGNAKVVEVPPGPPVLSPIVAEVYGPDYRGQRAVARRSAPGARGRRRTWWRSTIRSPPTAARRSCMSLQNKAALLDVAQSDIVDVVRMGLAGEDVTPVHNTDSKFEIPVRSDLARRAAEFARRVAEAARPLARRAPGPGFGTGRGARAAARESDLPQGPAAGGVRRRRHGRQARFAAVRHVRCAQRDRRPSLEGVEGGAGTLASTSSASRPPRTPATASSGTASGRSPTRPSATWASPTASA